MEKEILFVLNHQMLAEILVIKKGVLRLLKSLKAKNSLDASFSKVATELYVAFVG
jgi:hypothetical protein